MKHRDCAQAHAIAAAVRDSRLSAPLREHILGCDVCRETASVTGFLATLAAQPDERPLPDAGDLYRRAQLATRLFGEPAPLDRALRRLALAEVLGVSVSGVALLSWLGWAGGELWQGLAASSWAKPLLGGLALPPAAASVLALGLLGASVSLVAMWPLLREE
jgi:hypothetical protein